MHRTIENTEITYASIKNIEVLEKENNYDYQYDVIITLKDNTKKQLKLFALDIENIMESVSIYK